MRCMKQIKQLKIMKEKKENVKIQDYQYRVFLFVMVYLNISSIASLYKFKLLCLKIKKRHETMRNKLS